jgi:hypothetical protein
VDGELSSVKVSWFDPSELVQLDLTEPNYRRRLLSPDRYPLELDGGERIAGFSIYESRWGVLAENDVPIRLKAQADLAAWFSSFQLDPWRGRPIETAARLLSRLEDLRTQAQESFVRSGLRMESGILVAPVP